MTNAGFFKLLKGAFAIKKTPFPLTRAICAGICSAVPIIVGIIFGNFQYGLIGAIGGFSYLYVWNEPYVQRAKKIFFVAIGFSVSISFGILTASSPILFSILTGLIGAVLTFVFGALKIPGPASIFFVIIFAMTSASHPDVSQIPLYAGLVFLGGMFSWIVAMFGWLFNPYGPETKAVQAVYKDLANLIDTVGTNEFSKMREKTVATLNFANDTLLAGYVSWNSSLQFKRLYLLKNQASAILSDILELAADDRANLPKEIGQTLNEIAKMIPHTKDKIETEAIIQPANSDALIDQLFAKIYDADAILNESLTNIDEDLKISKPSIKSAFANAFDKNSIVFITSLKYGIVLTIASLIAFAFDFHRSYWIPVSCGAVLLGSTIISTFHRGIQRSIGTVVGVLIAALILYNQPTGLFVALCSLVFSFFTELFMVKNYAFAVMFITPNSILIAEHTTKINNLSYFATARITDIIIGAIIGLLGVLLIGRQSASSRLPHLIAKTIRSESQLFFNLFAEKGKDASLDCKRKINKFHTNITNLRTIYTTALGEIPSNNEALEYLWPTISSIEQLGFHLSSLAEHPNLPVLKEETLSQLLFIFESMAKNVEQQQMIHLKEIPSIDGFSKIRKEISNLQHVINISQNKISNS